MLFRSSGLTRSITNNGGTADLVLNTDGSFFRTNGFFVSGGTFTAAANGGTLTIAAGSSVNFSNEATTGLLLVSNSTGWVAANYPDLRDIKPTNDTTGITTYFRNNLDTTNFISINTGSWTFTNYNGVAWVASPNESVNQARIWCKMIPAVQQTNNWRASLVLGPISGARRSGLFNQSIVSIAVSSATNSTWIGWGAYGNSVVNSAAIGAFSWATPASAASFWGQINPGPSSFPAWSTPVALRLTYTALTSNLAFAVVTPGHGNNIRFLSVFSSNNIAPLVAVGIVAGDLNGDAPQSPIRALTFEH